MLKVEEKFFERFDQAFTLFKNNFIWLFIPFFIYNFISVVIIGTISKYSMIKSLSWIENMEWLDFFSFLNNFTVVIMLVLWMIFFILYLLFYIAVFLWIIRSFKQAVNNENIDMLWNLKYGITNLFTAMKTYWYIFAYVALIPSLLFIVWWLFFNAGYFYNEMEILQTIWWGLIILSLIIFIVFAIYRWLKAIFWVYSAVNDDEYTKKNFIEMYCIVICYALIDF